MKVCSNTVFTRVSAERLGPYSIQNSTGTGARVVYYDRPKKSTRIDIYGSQSARHPSPTKDGGRSGIEKRYLGDPDKAPRHRNAIGACRRITHLGQDTQPISQSERWQSGNTRW